MQTHATKQTLKLKDATLASLHPAERKGSEEGNEIKQKKGRKQENE